MSAYSKKDKPDDDPTAITQGDVAAAFGDIAEFAPELLEYILTCYPPELMMHISPELRKKLKDANIQGDKKDNN